MKRMKYLAIASVIIIAVALSCSCFQKEFGFQDLAPDSSKWEYQVLKITDGDTIVVRAPWGWEERVRMLGINAPERHHPDYLKAKASLARLLTDSAGEFLVVNLVQDKPGKRDAFGRILAYVEVDGCDIGLEMIRQGNVKVFVKYPFGRKAQYLEAVGQ